MKLEEAIKRVQPLDQSSMEAAWKHWDAIAKPLRSLGVLEEMIVTIAGIQKTPRVDLGKRTLLAFCADNGVVEEGVTQTGQEVTAMVAENFLTDKATTSIFCEMQHVEMLPIDIGMVTDTKVRKCKIAYGTKNFVKEPAMTRDEAIRAIEVGIALAEEKYQEGVKMLATGEMGIGNTTTSSAVASVLLEQPVELMTGRGAGLSSEGLIRKTNAIKKAIALHQPDPADPIDVLSKVGGFDICGMVGAYIGGAALGMPVIIDGFISGVAALAAAKLCPEAEHYMLASHLSEEPATKMIMEALHKKPPLHCGMRLGEGSGGIVLVPVLDMALEIYNRMATFEENNIETYVHLT